MLDAVCHTAPNLWHPLPLMAPSCGVVLARRRRQDRGRGRGEIRGRTAEQSLLLETQSARRHAGRKPQRTGYNPHSVGRQWCSEEESVVIMSLTGGERN